eukprot:Em0008g181a
MRFVTSLEIWPVRYGPKFQGNIVNEDTVTSSDPGLRLDQGITGVWQPQVEPLFDVHVVGTDTAIEHLMQFLSLAHRRKRECIKVGRRQMRHLLFSVDGLLHKEAVLQVG